MSVYQSSKFQFGILFCVYLLSTILISIICISIVRILSITAHIVQFADTLSYAFSGKAHVLLGGSLLVLCLISVMSYSVLKSNKTVRVNSKWFYALFAFVSSRIPFLKRGRWSPQKIPLDSALRKASPEARTGGEHVTGKLKRSPEKDRDINLSIHDILSMALSDLKLDILLSRVLETILRIEWLQLLDCGCIYLSTGCQGVLELRGIRNIPADMAEKYRETDMHHLLCAKKISAGNSIQTTSCRISIPAAEKWIPDHAHLTVPVYFADEFLGLIILFSNPGYRISRDEKRFFQTVANMLAIIIKRKQNEHEKENILKRMVAFQKLDSISTLAGGIGNDFNNILSIISGNIDLSFDNIDDRETLIHNLNDIRSASNRAAKLVDLLLSFSRQSKVNKQTISLTNQIAASLKLFQASIPSAVHVNLMNTGNDLFIYADSNHINQAIILLLDNAVHRMGGDGQLSISLKKIHINGDPRGFRPDLSTGPFVELRVTDSGAGIPPDRIDFIFDPYYAARHDSGDTGPELAAVYHIARDHDGFIHVRSGPAEGTSFFLYFPVVKPELRSLPYSHSGTDPLNARILFIDDETSVIRVTEQMLRGMGYQVDSADNPVDGLFLFKEKPDTYDLVISDMTMPRFSGDLFACRIKKIREDIPFILITGFPDQICRETMSKMGIHTVLHKPFAKEDLENCIHSVLDSAPRKAPVPVFRTVPEKKTRIY